MSPQNTTRNTDLVERPLRIAVIGYGRWGANWSRVAADGLTTRLTGIYDEDVNQRAKAIRRHGTVVRDTIDKILHADQTEAVIVATPPSTHHAIATAAIQAGKHVVVTKPLATNARDAEDLVRLAASRGVSLLVDHTFVYTAAVGRLAWLVRGGELGDLLYWDSVRVNLGIYQHDTDVVWDLAPHDLSILAHVVREEPVAVQCVGGDMLGTGRADVAYLTVRYPSGLLAHVHVNWLSPVKVRRTIVGGRSRAVVYDDVEPTEKVRVYDSRAVPLDEAAVDYRTGDMHAPKLDTIEALAREAAHLAEVIRGRSSLVLTPGAQGVAVVRVLEAASASMAADGQTVPLVAHDKQAAWVQACRESVARWERLAASASTDFERARAARVVAVEREALREAIESPLDPDDLQPRNKDVRM